MLLGLFIYLARRTAYLRNPFSAASEGEGVGTSFFPGSIN